jgi:hypothetical protein
VKYLALMPKWEGSPWEGKEIIPTGKVVFTPYYGWEITLDTKTAPCPMCWGEGAITEGSVDENGYEEVITILCPRCEGQCTYQLEQDNDGQKDS